MCQQNLKVTEIVMADDLKPNAKAFEAINSLNAGGGECSSSSEEMFADLDAPSDKAPSVSS